MSEDHVPYIKPTLAFDKGRLSSCTLEESIYANVRLIITNPVQGSAKGSKLAADPVYGAALPHHEFRQGRVQDVVQQVRLALKRSEPRFDVDRIEFVGKKAGRFLPYRTIRIVGKVKATGNDLTLDIDIEK